MQEYNKSKIKSFTDLQAWQHAHQLALLVYGLTKNYPKEEKYSLVDQMKRAALSVTSNIAEGFGRQGQKEKIQFYFTAKASLTELQNQLLFSKDIGYLKKSHFDDVANQTITVSKLLVGLIRAIKRQ
jgi:four helix bundle protein